MLDYPLSLRGIDGGIWERNYEHSILCDLVKNKPKYA